MPKTAYPPETIPIDQFVKRCFDKTSALLHEELGKESPDPTKMALISNFQGLLVATFSEMVEEVRAKMQGEAKGTTPKRK